ADRELHTLPLPDALPIFNTQVQAIAAPGLDLNRVYVVGVSLGGILGSVFTTVNQAAISNDAQLGLSSNLNSIKGLVASTSATQVDRKSTRLNSSHVKISY